MVAHALEAVASALGRAGLQLAVAILAVPVPFAILVAIWFFVPVPARLSACPLTVASAAPAATAFTCGEVGGCLNSGDGFDGLGGKFNRSFDHFGFVRRQRGRRRLLGARRATAAARFRRALATASTTAHASQPETRG